MQSSYPSKAPWIPSPLNSGSPDRPFGTGDAFRIATMMSMVAWLISSPIEAHWALDLFLVAGLVHPTLYRERTYWLLFSIVFLVAPWRRPWLDLDNHHWLEAYWVVAIALSRWGRTPDQTLKDIARLLLGLAFAFATLWKLISPEFMSGGFFEFTFLIDHRLSAVASTLGLQPGDAGSAGRAALQAWQNSGVIPEAVTVTVSDTMRWLAPVMAWLTVVIEGGVAVAFLLPLAPARRWIRDASLLLFVVATYPLAPVLGFGRLLLAMGVMQSELKPQLRNHLYVATFVGLSILQSRTALLSTLGNWLR
jgi:hypothetical protein